MRGKLRAAFKLFCIVGWLLLLYPGLWVSYMLGKPAWRDWLIHLCNRGLLVIIGIRLIMNGELAKERPLLMVTNHVSYLDIILIAACANVKFTPKSEIRKWFFIGRWCELCGSVFINRRAEKVAEMKQVLHKALSDDKAVCLFPEATTGNGVELKDFKSGFFNLAKDDFEGRHLYVQPAAVIYTHIGGLPLGRSQWPSVAWYGDMELAPHLWQLLMMPGISAEMVFLPAIHTEGHADRKVLAAECQHAISEAIEAVRQRPRLLAAAKPKGFNPSSLRKK